MEFIRAYEAAVVETIRRGQTTKPLNHR